MTAADQQAAALSLLGRLLPTDAAAAFELELIDCDEADRLTQGCNGDVTVARHGNSVRVVAGSGIDLAAGAYWFLKYRCGDGVCTEMALVSCASTTYHSTKS